MSEATKLRARVLADALVEIYQHQGGGTGRLKRLAAETIEAAAEEARIAEREGCARVAEASHVTAEQEERIKRTHPQAAGYVAGVDTAAGIIANAIRKRGEGKS